MALKMITGGVITEGYTRPSASLKEDGFALRRWRRRSPRWRGWRAGEARGLGPECRDNC